MDGTTILIIIAVVALLAFVFFRGVNPESKTDSQLKLLHSRAIKAGNYGKNDLLRIEGEMRKRGLLADSGVIDSSTPDEAYLVQLHANQLRSSARAAYREGWKKAEAQGKGERICHECGLTETLIQRLQSEPDCPPLDEGVVGALMFEQMPFNIMGYEEGKDAMAEYMVWREFPMLANEGVIQSAIESIRKDGLDEILAGVSEESLSWVAWSKFLKQSN